MGNGWSAAAAVNIGFAYGQGSQRGRNPAVVAASNRREVAQLQCYIDCRKSIRTSKVINSASKSSRTRTKTKTTTRGSGAASSVHILVHELKKGIAPPARQSSAVPPTVQSRAAQSSADRTAAILFHIVEPMLPIMITANESCYSLHYTTRRARHYAPLPTTRSACCRCFAVVKAQAFGFRPPRRVASG